MKEAPASRSEKANYFERAGQEDKRLDSDESDGDIGEELKMDSVSQKPAAPKPRIVESDSEDSGSSDSDEKMGGHPRGMMRQDEPFGGSSALKKTEESSITPKDPKEIKNTSNALTAPPKKQESFDPLGASSNPLF